MLEGLRGEQSIRELCRREGIASNLYYRWSKDFLEAGKKRLSGDTLREATSNEVKELRKENRELKQVVAETVLHNRVLKKKSDGQWRRGRRYMRRTVSEKLEIIRLVEESELSVRQTLREIGTCRSTFYEWYARYLEDGVDGLTPRKRRRVRQWNVVPERVREAVVKLALERTELSPRELACRYTDDDRYFVSESTVYRILKSQDLITSPAYVLLRASDSFKHPTRRVHELWQSDFTHLRVVDWGWYYLSTVMDDFSRFIIAWTLSSTMGTADVQNTLDLALQRTGVEQVHVRHRPRLLSDNGPAYVSGELRRYLSSIGMTHTRGAPYHPMTQGKIERWHRSMKNVIKLEHYYSPGELEAAISNFVDYYNHERYHESLNNVTPADVYYGRDRDVLSERAKIKRLTMQNRRKENQAAGAA